MILTSSFCLAYVGREIRFMDEKYADFQDSLVDNHNNHRRIIICSRSKSTFVNKSIDISIGACSDFMVWSKLWPPTLQNLPILSWRSSLRRGNNHYHRYKGSLCFNLSTNQIVLLICHYFDI